MPKLLFSEEQKRQIVERYLSGEGSTALARIYKCSPETIRRYVRDHQYETAGRRRTGQRQPYRYRITLKHIREIALSGQEIRRARQGAGFSQSELAHLIGVEIDVIRRWEHEQSVPSGVMLLRFMIACQVPAKHLVKAIERLRYGYQEGVCLSCGETRVIQCRSLCGRCYQIHRAAGDLDQFPPMRQERKR